MEEYIIDILKNRVPIKMDNTKSRNEKDFLVATTGLVPRFVILNRSSKEIYNLCDGNSNIDNIIKNIAESHPETDTKKLAHSVIIGMRDMESANLITLINRDKHEK